ncbi:MAG TPA: type II toxin-antitoxin system RelE/ParE family toxin [Candidatus Brocadiia bacterium]|nr:type II toxin-antitoxin system RelE/ParE family toxin [Candidatus Brocadiia bacterium]
MNVFFLSIARQELDDAFVWYESQSGGLGYEFLDEVDRVIRRVNSFPDSCLEIEPGLRRALVNRFPYGLIYGHDSDSIVVVAVAHLHREPRYWISRFCDDRT